MSRRHRRCEQGLFRGCCLGLVLLLALLGFAVFIVDRAVAAPSLGPGPMGPSHGSSEQQIALELAAELAAQLAANAQGVVTVSEHDLTVIAAENNPHPDRLHNLEAVVRDGDVLVAAQTYEGPLTVTAVAYLSIAYDQTLASISVHVVRLDLGQLTVPGWIRDRLIGTVSPTLAVDRLFAAPALLPLRSNIECVAVRPGGLSVGVHRPGATPDPSICTP